MPTAWKRRRPLACAVVLAFAALTTPAASAEAAVVVFDDGGYGKALVKPDAYRYNNHDYLSSMRWRAWGGPKTRGVGTANIIVCKPDCASGHYRKTPVKATFSNLTRYRGRRAYTCLTLRFQAAATQRWGSC